MRRQAPSIDGMFAALLLHISLALPRYALTPAVREAAVAEAAAIWSPADVVVTADTSCGTVLHVVVGPPPPRHVGTPLGALSFEADGTPAPTITLYLSAIHRLIETGHFFGLGASQWSIVLRERILGRVVGRVLAHEIGHYVFRSRGHTTTGLMRPMQAADELVSPARERFAAKAAQQ
jgi:hypothetical protein